MRQCAGFTLVELITCIVIIGVLAALVGPRFFSNQVYAEKGYIDELAAALRSAQRVAVVSACDVRVTIAVGGYQARQRAAAGNQCALAGAWPTPVLRADGAPLAGTPPQGANVAPATQIVFNSTGAVTGAAPPVLSVGAFTLSVDPLSGFVTVP